MKIINIKQSFFYRGFIKIVTSRKLMLLMLLCLCCTIAILDTVTVYADFGNFAGSGDYGGSNSGGGGIDGDFDLGMEAVTWIIAIIFVLVLMIYYLIKDKVTGGKVFGDKAQNKTSDGTDLCTMAEFKTIDPGFDEAALKEQLANLYVQMQQFWHEKDIEPIRPYVTDAFYNQSARQINDLKQNEQTPCTERIAVLGIVPKGFYQSGGMDHMVVKVSTRIVAYILDDRTGDVIAGDKKKEKFMEYEWDICRKSGIITEKTDGFSSVVCPHCGALLNINQSAKCPYCGGVITGTNCSWAINSIKGLSQATW